jgi:hypothetical protein
MVEALFSERSVGFMEKGRFCFLSDQYYEDFQDKYLMRNKEVVDGVTHDRPCFFVFQDSITPEIL